MAANTDSDVWQTGTETEAGRKVGVLVSIPDALTSEQMAEIRAEFAEHFPAVWVRYGTRPSDGKGAIFAAMGANAEAVHGRIVARFDGWQDDRRKL